MADGEGTGPAVVTTTDGAVVTIRLNRPRKLNVVDFELCEALNSALAMVSDDADIRAVVLCGEGRSFCAGGDLGLFHSDPDGAARIADRLIDQFHIALRSIARMPKPVIAAVHGPLAGGGLSLAMGCDLVVADVGATFVSAYTKLGTTPDGGLTSTLTALVGKRRALELVLTNRRLDAQTALSWGLVNSVADAGQHEAAAISLAHEIAAASRGTTLSVKRLIGEGAHAAFEDQLTAEQQSFVERAGSADFREGISAFVERRPPRFPD